MTSIVIFASAGDKEKINSALETLGLEYEILAPTAKNVLHLAIGMVAGEDESTNDEPKSDEVQGPEKDAEEELGDESTANGEEGEVKESYRMARFNGEVLKVVPSKTNETIVYVQHLIPGAKTTYSLNESTVSFWTDNEEAPEQFGLLEMNNTRFASLFKIRQSKTGVSYIAIAKDVLEKTE